MNQDFDPLAIARQRIAQEAVDQTGSLDLSQLWLTELPEEIATLRHLCALNCRYTQVADLAPLAALRALEWLDCTKCRLNRLPDGFEEFRALWGLYLFNVQVPGVPGEILSQEPFDNCLNSVRAHYRDLKAGAAEMSDVKILVLGNGRAGKTQLRRRLRGEEFQPEWDSTHGIVVTSPMLPDIGGSPVRLIIWDFGGQDIYHGTHALFMRSRALFLIIWAKDNESTGEYETDGIRFRKHPLEYWGEFVRQAAGPDSAVLIVQTKCDGPKDKEAEFPISGELLNGFGYWDKLHYSAKTDRGRAALMEAFADAINWLRDPGRQGVAMIGAGRLRVQRRLEAMRDADAARKPDERQHRVLKQNEYLEICDQESDVSSPEHLLAYLNNAGIVFYRDGLFDDGIVLDQGWALDAIYAVFQRQNCYRQLRGLDGRFTRGLLEALVWQGYKTDEQKLFLGMMQSCGICFRHRRGGDGENWYIAPDLLPARKKVQRDLDEKWNATLPAEAATFEYRLLHPGLMRGVIARIGREAGMNALYWQGGVCVYEATTRAVALIEQEKTGDWGGFIRLRTQKGQAGDLLKWLVEWIDEEQARLGLKPAAVEHAGSDRAARDMRPGVADEADTPKLNFTPEPRAADQWFVSYAWGDATPEGRARANVVDELCAEARLRGIDIQRDKEKLGVGESISDFMLKIGRGDRIFVVLSKKYLRSPYCMFELFEIWRNSRADPGEFLNRVRVYALPDAQAWTSKDQIRIARFWKQEYNFLKAEIKKDPDIIGRNVFKEFTLTREFYSNISDILYAMGDIRQPRTLEELKEYGFNDMPPNP